MASQRTRLHTSMSFSQGRMFIVLSYTYSTQIQMFYLSLHCKSYIDPFFFLYIIPSLSSYLLYQILPFVPLFAFLTNTFRTILVILWTFYQFPYFICFLPPLYSTCWFPSFYTHFLCFQCVSFSFSSTFPQHVYYYLLNSSPPAPSLPFWNFPLSPLSASTVYELSVFYYVFFLSPRIFTSTHNFRYIFPGLSSSPTDNFVFQI